MIGFLLLWSTTTVPNVTFQLSKTKVQKWFRAEYIFPRVLQEPNTLFVPGIRVISSAESRKYYKSTQHTKPHKLRHYLPGTLQQFVPAGTAVHNQQDRRRASDDGRATEGERCMYTANTSAALPAVIDYTYFRTKWCISILVLLCTTNTSGGGRAKVGERRNASDNMYAHSNTAVSAVVSTFFQYIHMLCTTNTSVGGRAKVGERRRASDMYVHSNTAVPAVVVSTFFRYTLRVDRIYIYMYISSLASVRFFFLFFTTRTNFQRRRASDGGQATTYE